MPSVNLSLLFIGLALAGALFTLGYFFGNGGYVFGFRGSSNRRVGNSGAPPLIEDDDRQRMVDLLQSLSRWMQDYSGDVSKYQTNLQQLSRDVRQNMADADGDRQSAIPTNARMLTMISQIMSTNDELQSRLDRAEKQLEEQTGQIAAYLTEARTDGLTGLCNRRAFDKQLDEMFGIYRGGGASFVMILVDIDHFKMINDTHGHPVGDVVLQKLASNLSQFISDAKMVARFGGEEFAILTNAPLRTSAEQMNRLRKRIADEPIRVGESSINVTMSVGLSEPRDEIVIGPIVRRTDAALYCAKNRGRNRVYFDDGSGPQLHGAPEVVRP